jgi:hypothetical protein
MKGRIVDSPFSFFSGQGFFNLVGSNIAYGKNVEMDDPNPGFSRGSTSPSWAGIYFSFGGIFTRN